MATFPCFNSLQHIHFQSHLGLGLCFESHSLQMNLSSSSVLNARQVFDEKPHRRTTVVSCRLASNFESLVGLDDDYGDSSDCGEEKNGEREKKKKRKQKLRPNFHEQALKRWSVKIPSQRSSFPWQEGKNGLDASLLLPAKCSTENAEIGIGKEVQILRNRVNSLGERTAGHLARSLNDSSLDDAVSSSTMGVQGKPQMSEVPPTVLGTPAVPLPPWAHGVKTKKFHEDSGSESVKLVENSKARDKYKGSGNVLKREKLNGLLDKHDSLDGILDSSVDFEAPGSGAVENSQSNETLADDLRGHISDLDNEVAAEIISHDQDLDLDGETRVAVIVDRLKNSVEDQCFETDYVSYLHEQKDSARVMSSVPLPWEREENFTKVQQLNRNRNKSTELAERTIPELELRRLRDSALRMKERMTVGSAGVTEAVVQTIHEKWEVEEVVKLRFEGPPSLNMKRTHELLEMKTGGVVIWRSGRSVVLYRGMTYKLPCIQAYSEVSTGPEENSNLSTSKSPLHSVGQSGKKQFGNSKMLGVHSPSCSNQSEGFTNDSVIESLLDQLGPRFHDWSGRGPLPVDADLLPEVIPGYMPPFRLLPYKTRATLRDREMTYLRRLARSMAPHFALGRNRQHQGLASAMVKLWDKSAIAKIAIKRGIPNTNNERMAEELKKLTGGVLLSRNKEYLVFYRGNDFVSPSVREVLIEKQKLAVDNQDEEEKARATLSASYLSSYTSAKTPLIAGTLSETREAKAKWGNPLSPEERERLRKNMDLAKHIALVRYLERKLAFALAKVRKAEKALAKVQAFLQPAELPTDLETVTDEERSLFRQIGLKMKGQSLVGRRGVFDGTIENMHLNWKHREVVKILVKGKSFPLVKHIAISLEAESGGVLISLDKTTKGYAIILYRGKNYQRPPILKPRNLLTRRQALARSIELQRREALKHHIETLREKIQTLKSQLDQMESDMRMGKDSGANLKFDSSSISDDDLEDEGEEAYLPTYESDGDYDDDDTSVLE